MLLPLPARSDALAAWTSAAELPIDALHLERVDDGGGVVDERFSFMSRQMTSLSVKFLPKPGMSAILPSSMSAAVSMPAGAQNRAACRADVGELGSLDAEGCQIAHSLLGLGYGAGSGSERAWETAQLPLYTLWTTGTRGEKLFAVVHCTAGDVIIATVSLLGALAALAAPQWPVLTLRRVYLAAMALGICYTIYSWTMPPA